MIGVSASPLLHAAATSAAPIPNGQQLYTSSGTYIVPANVTRISVVTISCGGRYSDGYGWAGAGGGLSYVNDIAVTPGEALTIEMNWYDGFVVGLFRGATALCTAKNAEFASPGQPVVGTGFKGGGANPFNSGGGGGAAGYTSDGEDGQSFSSNKGGGGTSPNGGSWGAGGGGSVGGSYDVDGRNYGGGGSAISGSSPGGGCVRIIHGPNRAFPATNTWDLT